MNNRLELHNILVNIMGENKVYFNPPSNIQITYPCIIYSKNKIQNIFANNSVYNQREQYTITLIDKSVESIYFKPISLISGISSDDIYMSDNLCHYIFSIK